MLLQVLYDMIEHKDRILTGKRVARLEMSDVELARVHTKDGSVYEGDIVVGADGVHSATLRCGVLPTSLLQEHSQQTKRAVRLASVPSQTQSN